MRSNVPVFRDGKFMVGKAQWFDIAAYGPRKPYISHHGKRAHLNANEIKHLQVGWKSSSWVWFGLSKQCH